MRTGLMFLTCALLCAMPRVSAVAAVARESGGQTWEKRWIYVPSNLYVNDNVPKVEELMRRARAAGYNGVLFADYKTCTWWKLEAADRWKANARRLRETANRLNLELVVCVFPFGRSGALLFHDVNLAAGMPVRNALLVARDGRLVSEQESRIRNGSFEEHRGDLASGFSFQDDPSKGSFIDSQVAREGLVSLRFENVGQANQHGHGRICQRVDVRPWQQYRIRAWMKTENLTADAIQLLVLGGERTLQYQHLQVWKNGRLEQVGSARNLTTDWIEQSVTFNSLDNTNVNIYAGIWGGKTGTLWWDNLRLDPVPTLNLLRRDSLPLQVVGEDGTVYQEGKDFMRIADEHLGIKSWAGNYDTQHEPPVIRLTASSRIHEGQRVMLSCYHAVLVYDSQVDCSMDDPGCYAICEEELRRARDSLVPDGYFMSHDEIRCAGWEPRETEVFKSSGDLFASNIRRCFEIATREGDGRPVYVWSDMFDPNHNARKDYYLVNNTLAGSWNGLDPRIIVMKWGGGAIARPGLRFFADRGHRQMIAAFYDGDVEADHRMWVDAVQGIQGIVGVMYTTWRNDYAHLEEFARIWWGGAAVGKAESH